MYVVSDERRGSAGVAQGREEGRRGNWKREVEKGLGRNREAVFHGAAGKVGESAAGSRGARGGGVSREEQLLRRERANEVAHGWSELRTREIRGGVPGSESSLLRAPGGVGDGFYRC